MKIRTCFQKCFNVLSCLSISTTASFALMTSCQGIKPQGTVFNVQFNTQGGSFVDTIKAAKNSIISPPETVPTKSGYFFDGWYKESICQNKFNFSIPITHDVVVYAKWKKVGTTFHINFTTDGHGIVSKKEIVVVQGTKWHQVVAEKLLPEVIAFDGYTFEGWYKDNRKLTSSSQLLIMSNWNVVAHLTPPPDKHNIRFLTDSNGTLDKNNILVEKDQGITWKDLVDSRSLPIPTPSQDFTFNGWYKENGDTEIKLEDDDTTLIDGSWIILAKFQAVPPVDCKITLLNPPEDGFSIDQTSSPFFADLTINVSSSQIISKDNLSCLLVNGEKLLDYDFVISYSDPTKASIFIPGDKVIGNISIGFITRNAPKTDNFETDDWSIIIYYANRGLPSLMKAYNFESEDELIGLEKEISVNGYLHKVMVIGCNHDFTDEQKNSPVALTFQFENIVACNSYPDTALTWDEEDNKNYWESDLCNSMNSPDDDCKWVRPSTEKRSLLTMINESDYLLAKNIKTIYRGVNVYKSSNNSEGEFSLVTNKTKFFNLTLSDIFSIIGIQKTIIDPVESQLYINEGSGQYEYYTNTIGDMGFVSGTSIDSLIKKDVSGETTSYWLTSPSLSENYTAWHINTNGIVEGRYVNELTDSIAPCFCI